MDNNQRRIIEGQEELVNLRKRLGLNKLSESIKDNIPRNREKLSQSSKMRRK